MGIILLFYTYYNSGKGFAFRVALVAEKVGGRDSNNVRRHRIRGKVTMLIMMNIIIIIMVQEFTMNMVLRCYVGHEFEYGAQQPGKETTEPSGSVGTSAQYYNTILSCYALYIVQRQWAAILARWNAIGTHYR